MIDYRHVRGNADRGQRAAHKGALRDLSQGDPVGKRDRRDPTLLKDAFSHRRKRRRKGDTRERSGITERKLFNRFQPATISKGNRGQIDCVEEGIFADVSDVCRDRDGLQLAVRESVGEDLFDRFGQNDRFH